MTASVITAINRRQGKSAFQNLILGNTVNQIWIDDVDSLKEKYPRNDIVKFKADPLALTLSFRDQGLENWKITEKLTSAPTWDLFAEDRFFHRASEIKKYYRNKLMFKALKNTNHNMSKFRQDLYNYVESSDPFSVYKNDIPMIVKLPDFYEEDVMMDAMVKKYKMTGDYETTQNVERTLYPLQKHHRKTKNQDQKHFWFRDDNNLIYRIVIEPKNPLLHLFEKEFSKQSINVSATFYATRTRGQDYVFYSLSNWNIL